MRNSFEYIVFQHNWYIVEKNGDNENI
jgi:hypothetical protein